MKIEKSIFEDSLGNCLEYTCLGQGEHYLFCFPGFGEYLETFSFLADELSNYQIVAINLYFIASSQKINSQNPLQPEEWKATLAELLDHLSVHRFSVLGFSLGGRFASVTFKYFHKRMDHLILVAPDAIQMRFTYQLATFPVFFRQLFWLLMKFPKPFFLLIKALSAVHLINPFTAKFALKHMHSETLRNTLYMSWTRFKPFRVKQKELIELLNTSTCRSTIIFGKKDKIINPKKHLQFLSKLTKTKVYVLPFGHNKLVNNSIGHIRATLMLS